MRIRTAFLTVAVLGGCSSASEPEFPSGTGIIVARDVPSSLSGAPTMHVKRSPADECGTVYKVSSSTPIHRRFPDGRTERASLADLTVGTAVKVRAELELRSCPAQSVADAVEIVEGGAD